MDCLKELSREDLEDAYGVLEKLYEACRETLALMPPCPDHGAMCQSYYREWLTFQISEGAADEKVLEVRAELKRQDKKLEVIREIIEQE